MGSVYILNQIKTKLKQNKIACDFSLFFSFVLVLFNM